MTSRTARIGACTLLCWIVGTSVAHAQTPPPALDACQISIDAAMNHEQRLWRSVLYGLTPAEEAQLSETRTDAEGNVWIKTGNNSWRSAAVGYENTTWSNVLMAQRSDVPPRRGLLEQRRVLTSDILPPVLSAYRSLQCRLDALCEVFAASEESGAQPDAPITVQPEGCIAFTYQPFAACAFNDGADVRFAQTDARAYCNELKRRVLERETQLLRFAMEYDASYRSLLQFAGNFDLFLDAFRGTLLGSIRSGASLLGWLGRIPCFTASCDDVPSAFLPASQRPGP